MTASPTESKTIALIGARGSGKTAVGKALASLLGGDHVDTDDLVVERAGKSIAAIFADHGEAAFRALEVAAIARAVSLAPSVISVGGGAVVDQTNTARLRAIATVVWLTAPPEELDRRIQADAGSAAARPPLTEQCGIDEIRELLAERTPSYEYAADMRIDTTDKTLETVAAEIAERLAHAR
ncbi:MAG: shikimate kinase [Planctomycetes bacterium]|nr:shikimate kinase [Planctomycetota bacterium]